MPNDASDEEAKMKRLLVRERPVVRAAAAVLAIASLLAAAEGPLDKSALALAITISELVVGILLALVALGLRVSKLRN